MVNNQIIKKNSFHAWVLAARPKTLTGAIVPVLMGSALALFDLKFSWFPALICLIFAALMQMSANFINDLFDYLKGSDREDRLGPERACAQGWISPNAMKWGIAITVAVACLIGCILIYYGGWVTIAIGAASVLFAFLYTTCLSYYGMGDILVLIFFGLVPVGGTYYVQSLDLTANTIIISLACGLVIETLLVINNYRDRDADKQSGKRTLIVRFGEQFGRYLYLLSGLLAVALMLSLIKHHPFGALLPIIYIFPHYATWKEMVQIRSGKKLNSILGKTSRNMLLFGMLSTIGLIIDYLFPYILS